MQCAAILEHVKADPSKGDVAGVEAEGVEELEEVVPIKAEVITLKEVADRTVIDVKVEPSIEGRDPLDGKQAEQ